MADQDLFAPPSDEERKLADQAMFAPPTEEEKQSIIGYLKKPEISALESASAGAQQGLTLGHADELGGAVGAAMHLPGAGLGPEGFPLVPGAKPNEQSLEDLYKEYRDANRARLSKAEAANPWSAGAGTAAGGALGVLGAGMLAAPAEVASAAEAVPQALSMGQKMFQGAKAAALPGARIGALSAEGSSDAPLGSPEQVMDIGKGAGLGLGLGLGFGAVAPPLVSAAKGTGQAIKGASARGGELIEDVLSGNFGKTFNRGFGPTGRDSREWLIGKNAQRNAGSELLNKSENLVSLPQEEAQKLGGLKNELIDAASEKGIRIPSEEIDTWIQGKLGDNPLTTLDSTKKEIQQFRKQLLEARDGEEVQRVRRAYFGEGNTQLKKFEQLMQEKQAAEAASKGEVAPPSEREAFEEHLAKLKAEQQAIAGHQSPTPYEASYETMENQPGKVLGVIKQPQYDDQGNFNGYKKIHSRIISDEAAEAPIEMQIEPHPEQSGKVMGIIRRPVKDAEGNITGYDVLSQKTLNAQEEAKFKDVAETVREKKFDLSNPKHLYQLRKDLKVRGDQPKNPWEAEKAFSSPEAQGQVKSSMNDINEILRNHIPELQPVDQQLTAYNQALEELPIKKGVEAEDVGKKMASLILQSRDAGPEAAHAKRTLENYFNKLRIANPELAHKLEGEMAHAAETQELTGAAAEKSYLPRPLAKPQPLAAKAGNIAGYSIGYVTPQWLRNLGSNLAQKGTQASASLGKVMTEMAEKDDRTRNAMMFVLMQNPAYQGLLKEHLPEADPGSSAASTKTLEKFK